MDVSYWQRLADGSWPRLWKGLTEPMVELNGLLLGGGGYAAGRLVEMAVRWGWAAARGAAVRWVRRVVSERDGDVRPPASRQKGRRRSGKSWRRG